MCRMIYVDAFRNGVLIREKARDGLGVGHESAGSSSTVRFVPILSPGRVRGSFCKLGLRASSLVSWSWLLMC